MKSYLLAWECLQGRQFHVIPHKLGKALTWDKAFPAPYSDENSGTEVHIALDEFNLIETRESGL